MALILGSSNGNILQSRAMQELTAELDKLIADQAAYLMPEQHSSLINGLTRDLLEEKTWEDNICREIQQSLKDLEQAPDIEQLKERYNSFNRIARRYFKRRESPLSMHDFCGRSRDIVVGWGVKSVLAKRGGSTNPFTICALGNYGRKETTLTSPCDLLLIYGNTDSAGEAWFSGFADDISLVLSHVDLSARFMRLDDPDWRGEIDVWKSRIASQAGTPDPSSETVSLCDLRPVFGEPELAKELRSLAHLTLVNDPFSFLSALRTASIMPVGFNFFGRLRMEKSGSHKGEFNLTQFALAPMVVTLRMLSIQKNIEETATPDRIRKLQQAGELGVDLASKLLNAYHDFQRIKLSAETEDKGNERDGFYLDREEISHYDEGRLKQGLDTLFNLQRIVYQNVES